MLFFMCAGGGLRYDAASAAGKTSKWRDDSRLPPCTMIRAKYIPGAVSSAVAMKMVIFSKSCAAIVRGTG